MSYKTVRKGLSSLVRLFPKNDKARDFILWPLAHKLLPEDYSEIITLGNGIRMWVYQDIYDMTNKTLMFLGEDKNFVYEPGTSGLFSRLVKEKKTVLIAGGHLGYYALLAAKVNPHADVYVFEPTKKMFDRLSKNIALNSFNNIYPEHKALSNIQGEVEIVVDNGQSSLIKHEGNSTKKREMVEAVTIDSYFQDKETKPGMILLDVEGFEALALEGAQHILALKPDLILEVNSKMLGKAGTSEALLYEMLSSKGYNVEKIDEMTEEKNHRYFNIFATQKHD